MIQISERDVRYRIRQETAQRHAGYAWLVWVGFDETLSLPLFIVRHRALYMGWEKSDEYLTGYGEAVFSECHDFMDDFPQWMLLVKFDKDLPTEIRKIPYSDMTHESADCELID